MSGAGVGPWRRGDEHDVAEIDPEPDPSRERRPDDPEGELAEPRSSAVPKPERARSTMAPSDEK